LIPDGAMLTYSIVGSADAAKFNIDFASGALSFVTAPDFEAPADADHDNSYEVVVRASDAMLSSDQSIHVKVADIAEQSLPVVKSGDEIVVNTTTESHQYAPALAAFANGHFVATWTDLSETGGDTSSEAVRAQLFNADGSKLGNGLLVNSATVDSQDQPAITVLSDGRFVEVWSNSYDAGSDGTAFDLRAQIFNADGSRFGNEFVVSSTAVNENGPVVGALADGRFVAAFTGTDQDGGGDQRADLQCRRHESRRRTAGQHDDLALSDRPGDHGAAERQLRRDLDRRERLGRRSIRAGRARTDFRFQWRSGRQRVPGQYHD
jgi:hypothetical protein